MRMISQCWKSGNRETRFWNGHERLETENAWRSRVRDVLAARATEAANRRDAQFIGCERHVPAIDARAF